jgi:hypothetical protein
MEGIGYNHREAFINKKRAFELCPQDDFGCCSLATDSLKSKQALLSTKNKLVRLNSRQQQQSAHQLTLYSMPLQPHQIPCT